MRISHKHKFIFFANPRTGSTSVRDLVDPYSDFHGAQVPVPPMQPFHDHMRPFEARDAFRKLGWDYEAYYSFTFVRNPWKRLASTYAFIRALRKDYRLPFQAWLASVKPYGPGGGGDGTILETWRRYGTYSIAAFAGDGSGKLFVNDVFRLEDVDDVPDKLRRRGLPLPPGAKVPVINDTRGTVNYRELYGSQQAIDFVGDLYADDIKRYRYKFPRD